MIHTVKGFGIINKAEVDVFLELSCFFDDLVDFGNLISGSSVFSKSSLNIWKFMIHVLLNQDQIANIHWIMEKPSEFQKNIYFCFVDYAKAFDCVENS